MVVRPKLRPKRRSEAPVTRCAHGLSPRGKCTGTFILTVGCALVTVVIPYGHCGPHHGQGGWRGIPGNSLGQGFTSSSTLTHLLGVSGAPTGTVGGAAVGRRSMRVWDPSSRWARGFLGRRYSATHTECRHRKKNRVCNANWGPKRRLVVKNERFVTLALYTCHVYLAMILYKEPERPRNMPTLGAPGEDEGGPRLP